MSVVRLSAAQKKVVSKWELNDYTPIKVSKEGVDRGDVTIDFKKTQRLMTPLPNDLAENAISETYSWHECQVRVSKLGTEHKYTIGERQGTIYPHCDYPNAEASASYRAIADRSTDTTAYSDIAIQPTSTAIQCSDTAIQRKVSDRAKGMSKKQQVNFRIDTDLLEALKEQAQTEGISYTDLIQRLCRQGLSGGSVPSETPVNQHQSNDLTDTVKQLLYSDDIQQVLANIVEKQLQPIKQDHQETLGK
jgi:predicted DNA binding CopG/RHH family protein